MIMEKDRVILIRHEMTEPKDWRKLLDSLTFEEGMAMMQAMTEWGRKFKLLAA